MLKQYLNIANYGCISWLPMVWQLRLATEIPMFRPLKWWTITGWWMDGSMGVVVAPHNIHLCFGEWLAYLHSHFSNNWCLAFALANDQTLKLCNLNQTVFGLTLQQLVFHSRLGKQQELVNLVFKLFWFRAFTVRIQGRNQEGTRWEMFNALSAILLRLTSNGWFSWFLNGLWGIVHSWLIRSWLIHY